jgi:hypothetical protein
MRTVVRETVLRRRRSRLPWMYLVYHVWHRSAAERRATPPRSAPASVSRPERGDSHDRHAGDDEQGADRQVERLLMTTADAEQREAADQQAGPYRVREQAVER